MSTFQDFEHAGGMIAISGKWTVVTVPHCKNDLKGLQRMATAICSDKENPQTVTGIRVAMGRLAFGDYALMPYFDQDALNDFAEGLDSWHSDRHNWPKDRDDDRDDDRAPCRRNNNW